MGQAADGCPLNILMDSCIISRKKEGCDTVTNEEMSLKTKQAFAKAPKNAMENKKLSKITVSELCAACNVNRKTFYYHFEDIYALLKWLMEREAVEVVKHFNLVVNTEEAIRFVMDYVDRNKHIINGVFDSMVMKKSNAFFIQTFFRSSMEPLSREKKIYR